MSPARPAISEPARATPVCHEADLCVVGGSCTGLFAAVRAARLGLSVAVVEQQSLLGGMAVAAQVNEWHSTWDVSGRRRVIGGLTIEIVERLRRRGAIEEIRPVHRGEFRFNSAELAAELDELAREHRVRVFFAARCVAAAHDDEGRIAAAVVEDRSGRRAIRARAFIDASGDGSLVRAAGLPLAKPDTLQPVNLQALVHGLDGLDDHTRWSAIRDSLASRGYPPANGNPWPFSVPGASVLRNLFGARLHGLDAADADDHGRALVEGRRLHRLYLDALREHLRDRDVPPPTVVAWAHALGVRQTRHAVCLHRLAGAELLTGHIFPDAIAQGTYPIDIHTPDGVVLRYLDGREEHVSRGGDARWGRWRDESAPTPACYGVPYRSLVPLGSRNLLVAGRLLDADREAFGGVRVMVNMNQTGEAAGVAACLALDTPGGFPDVSVPSLRDKLVAGGSAL
jgi:2-polyprenyl-6-methoxyphenol hydroxylase-like FAD-dependent oxidoreductase